MTSAAYVGRFAPSPTGLLHFGSLLAAMASFCDARSQHGCWHLRIDDIDPPRELQGAATQFPVTLRTYGFDWDGPILKQSEQTQKYHNALQRLNDQSLLYPCNCSRRELINQAIYPGNCKPDLESQDTIAQAAREVSEKLGATNNACAIRVIIDADLCFKDLIQGDQQVLVGEHIGDTVVLRKDNLFAYILACAIDDADGISRVVRGADLLPTSAAQIHVLSSLNLSIPEYAHIPVMLNSKNQKLSKQTQAEPIDAMPVLPTLLRAWQVLGQTQIHADNVETFWQKAIDAWRLSAVPNMLSTNG